MGRRKEETPNGIIRSALRQVWLRSRERRAALKRDGYTCQICGKKQSRAKGREVHVEVHHKTHIVDWDGLIQKVREELLCHPDDLVTLCKECHHRVHEEEKMGLMEGGDIVGGSKKNAIY